MEQNEQNQEFDFNAVYLFNESNNPDPEYATLGASGMDLRAELSLFDADKSFNTGMSSDGILTIYPGGRALIPTGLHFALPQGLEFQVRPRSGLALKHGITVLNTPGTIDSDYRGGVGVILVNLGADPFEVKTGDRIAQLVLMGYARILRYARVDKLEDLPSSERMQAGFGSTGMQ
jgi:dUTP pyrophosphatase